MNLAEEKNTHQGDLFNSEKEKERRLEESILKINEKFPEALVRRGRSILSSEKS
jgi:DNA polymerase-4